MSTQTKSNHNWIMDRFLLATGFILRSIAEPFIASFKGYRDVSWCFAAMGTMFMLFILGVDGKILFYYDKAHIYDHPLYSTLQFFIGTAPVLGYGIYYTTLRYLFIFDLRNSFDRCGLQNALKEYPGFISLDAKDGESLKLRLKNNGLSLADWKSKKERIEANLQVYIDTIELVREKGIIEIIFSTRPMPTHFNLRQIERYHGYKFLVGQNRTSEFEIDFTKDPHLLVAGESGGGKTYFIRQMLSTIKNNHPETVLKIADLKNGGDFKCFDGIQRVDLTFDPKASLAMLEGAVKQIQIRMEKLKAAGLENIFEYHRSEAFLSKSKQERLKDECGHRIFIVVDEFAELVLNGGSLNSQEVKAAKEALSKISRLGRSCGIHLILATQRPDKTIVDAQVRSNLTSTVCFRLNDLGGSLAVLGSKTACELPQVKGRAIFLKGSDEHELQTPLLLPEKVDELLTNQKKEVLDENQI